MSADLKRSPAVQFEVAVCGAFKGAKPTPDDRRALLQEHFDIIHFSGHSNGQTLCFEDEGGRSQERLLESLAAYVRDPSLKCVVLNSCDSLATLNTSIADYTVGMEKGIQDEAAVEFANGFYDALAAGRDIVAVVEEGRNAAALLELEAPVRVLRKPR